MRILAIILRTVAFLAGSGALIVEAGFHLDSMPELAVWVNRAQLGACAVLGFDILFAWLRSFHKAAHFREHLIPLSAVLILLGAVIGVEAGWIPTAHWYVVTQRVVLMLLLATEFFSFIRHLVAHSPSPALALLGSFVALITVGSILLSLPAAVLDGAARLDPLTAIFMSTSATCVTGLALISMNDLSFFGQGVILVLIQIGGLGLLTFIALFSLTLKRGLGLRERVALREALNTEDLGHVGRLVRWVVVLTISIEALGALGIWLCLDGAPHWSGGGGISENERLWGAAFHSISAFCNGGFALYDDSLTLFKTHVPLGLVVSALIIIGGLGFVVLIDFLDLKFTRMAFVRRSSLLRRLLGRAGEPGPARLGVQTRLMLVGTTILLVAGFFIFFVLERPNPEFADMSVSERLTACFFQSVTLRTAGFNTLDFAGFGATTLLFCIGLMLIGGGPGGTAGGLKVSTLALMLLSVAASARGDDHVTVFRRRLPAGSLQKALVVVSVFSLGFFFVSGLLFLTDGDNIQQPLHLLFEAASAYATVGISTGITSALSPAGHCVLIFAMIAGRLGPLTVVLAMGRKRSERVIYPRENVMIG